MKIYDLLFADGSIFITVPTNDPKEELKRAQINFPVVSYREVVEPELTLEELKENKRLELKVIRDEKEAGGFFYLGKIFDSNQLYVQRISNTAQTYLMGKLTNQELPDIGWTTQDNEVVDLTPDQVLGMQQALTIHGAKVHAIYGELKALAEQAETIEELELISWPEALEGPT